MRLAMVGTLPMLKDYTLIDEKEDSVLAPKTKWRKKGPQQ